MAYDYYSTVISPTERTIDRHNHFDEIALLRGLETGKPLFKWVEFDQGCTELGVRLMRPVELHCVAYQSLINGNRALSYWSARPWNDDAWEEMTRIGAEIKGLTPALGAPDSSVSAECSDKAVRVLLKANQGRYYLIAANTSAQEKKVGIRFVSSPSYEETVPLFTKPPALREMFGRAGGEFRDGMLFLSLEQYGVRSFEITPAQ